MRNPVMYITALFAVTMVVDIITGLAMVNFILESGLVIPVLLLVLAGIANGVMDTIAHHDGFKQFKFWSADAMANSKYNSDRTRKKFLKYIPIPVFLLDGWHLSKSIMLWSLSLAPAYIGFKGWEILAATLIIRAAFAAGFHFSYR